MDHLLHRPASVGSLVKKIMAINPDLGVPDIIEIVREATRREKDGSGFGSSDVVDEKKALELARARAPRSN
jgi:hypothetical protein